MTPTQAEELHELIRTSEYDEAERKRLHGVVERNIDAPARKGMAYIKVTSDGTAPGSHVFAVDTSGRAHELEVGRVEIHMCPRDGVSATLHFPRQCVELDLNLETSDVAIARIAEHVHLQSIEDDLDADPITTEDITDVAKPPCDVVKPPGWRCTRGKHPVGTPCAAVPDYTQPAPPKNTVRFEATPGERVRVSGPHVHSFVNGTCNGCGKREP